MNNASASHLDDGDLARLADGECSGSEAREFRAHLVSCSECRVRNEKFTRLASAFGAAIERAGPVRPGAARRGANPSGVAWWRGRPALAAGLAFLFVAGIVASPARGWLAARWSALTADSSDVNVEGAGEDPVPEAATERAVITFRPRVAEFVVEVTGRQAAGALTIEVHEDLTARASVIGGLGSEGFLVQPEGLRIANAPESTADYLVRLPKSVSTVVVRIAGELVEHFELGMAPAERRFELAAR